MAQYNFLNARTDPWAPDAEENFKLLEEELREIERAIKELEKWSLSPELAELRELYEEKLGRVVRKRSRMEAKKARAVDKL
jgi:hypothetical protein